MQTIFAWLKNRKLILISLIGVVCVPLIYGGLYLWAFWDPYAGMKNISIAVVNEDKGAYKDSTSYTFGKKIEDKLAENQNLHWVSTTKGDAEKGLGTRRYYGILTIQSDFSTRVISVDSDTPQKAFLQIKTRETNSFFSSKYIRSVTNELANTVQKEIQQEYFDNVFVEMRKVGDGLQEGADGAQKLSDALTAAQSGSTDLFNGILSAKTGSVSLKDGILQLFDGSNTLKNGVAAAHTGSTKLRSGLGDAYTGSQNIATGSAALAGGMDQIQSGLLALQSGGTSLTSASTSVQVGLSALHTQVATLSATTNQLVSQTDGINSQAKDIKNGLEAYMSKNQEASDSAELQSVQSKIIALQSDIQTLQDKTQAVNGGVTGEVVFLNQLAQGQQQYVSRYAIFINSLDQIVLGNKLITSKSHDLASGALTLKDGIVELKQGSETLDNGLSNLDTGSHTLSDNLATAKSGSDTLVEGMTKLSTGASDLNTGLEDISTGSSKLHTSLADGANEIQTKTNEQKVSDKLPVLANPILVQEEKIAPVPNNGTAFAPYFIPLSLWVGAMSIFFVLEVPKSKRYHSFRSWLKAQKTYIVALGIGFAQAIALPYVMIHGLKLNVITQTGIYVFSVVLSLLFVSIQYWLLYRLKRPGRFVGIILLMLQLTSSSGTYPVETSNGFFQTIAPYLPMTYAVRVLREIITGGNWSLMTVSYQVVAGGMVLAMGSCLAASYSFPVVKRIAGGVRPFTILIKKHL
ncbi:YhgE/Pip domain-containing protein [Candidatus Roizmanbacteria bacterium]|nr:YhgE/Pip domain-containing protein [Candidatus Roizmanbacteria bacterium]